MTDVRLVMASGSSPGAGKTTLVEYLAEALADGGVTVITEDEVWGARSLEDEPVDHAGTRPEFIELLHSERPRATEALEAAFDQVAERATGTWWLQDWTWPDLAAMALGRSEASKTEGLLGRLHAYRAVVLYLKVPVTTAISRAVSERGTTWLRGHALGLGLPPDSDATDVAAFYEQFDDERLRSLDRSGLRTVVLDAGRPTPQVVADALDALAT